MGQRKDGIYSIHSPRGDISDRELYIVRKQRDPNGKPYSERRIRQLRFRSGILQSHLLCLPPLSERSFHSVTRRFPLYTEQEAPRLGRVNRATRLSRGFPCIRKDCPPYGAAVFSLYGCCSVKSSSGLSDPFYYSEKPHLTERSILHSRSQRL